MERTELIEFLSNLVSFDTTINPDKNLFPTEECANFVKEHARKHGFDIIDVDPTYFQNDINKPLYPVLVTKRGTKPGKTVLFLGHIDVVPVSTAELVEWDHEPFEPDVVEIDGITHLRGRGAGDMKGGVAAFFAAFDRFELNAGQVVIALSGDEEIGGLDTMPALIAALEERELEPDYVINAEGSATPVIVTQRRGGTQVKFEFDLDYDRVTGTETTKIFKSRLGDGGSSLHSMSFVLGSDTHAMITAGKMTMDKPVIHVESSSEKTNSVPRNVTITYVEKGGTTEYMYSQGLTKLMHALASIGSINLPIIKSKYGPAINPNLLEIDQEAGKGAVTFDIRAMLDGSAHQGVVDAIQQHFVQYGLTTTSEIVLSIDPVNVSPEHELAVWTKEIAESLEFPILTAGEKLGGASDTRFFTTLGIPGIELGPIAHGGHGINESVEIESIEKLKLIYRTLYKRIQSE